MKQKTYEQLKLDNQLCFPLYAAARRVMNLYTPYLAPLGLTYTQYIVMLVLWEEDGIRVGRLCERLHLDTGTVTPLLKKLEAQGLVTRSRSAGDERVMIIALTQAGQELKERAVNVPAQVGRCIAMTPEEAVTLHRLLHRLLEA